MPIRVCRPTWFVISHDETLITGFYNWHYCHLCASIHRMRRDDPILRYSIDEICEHAESAREAHPLLRLAEPVDKRLVRYYVQQKLLPGATSRGPGTTYPESMIWRLLFIMLLKRHGLSLQQIRKTLRKVPEATMQRVVEGQEPLAIQSGLSAAEIDARVNAGEQVVFLHRDSPENSPEWQVIANTDSLKIEVRMKRLSPHQRKLVRRVASLLRDVVILDPASGA